MSNAMVDQVRRFNRVVTERVGALDDRFLGRSRPLGQARVLWEIGLEGSEVRSDKLAASLLDPLTPEQRERLVVAMREVERLLVIASLEIRPVDPECAD